MKGRWGGWRSAPGSRGFVRPQAKLVPIVSDGLIPVGSDGVHEFVVTASGNDVVAQALSCQLAVSPRLAKTPAATEDPPATDDKPESSGGRQSRDRASPPSAMIALYTETYDMRSRIERLLANADVETTGSRKAFRTMVRCASVGIASLGRCEDEDVEWLRAVFRHGHSGPSCVVVTPLSLARLQRLRRIESTRFHAVWAEEVEDRLVQLLDDVEPWHRDPLRSFRLQAASRLLAPLVAGQGDRPHLQRNGKPAPHAAHPLRDRACPAHQAPARHAAPLLERGSTPAVRPQAAAELGPAHVGDPTALRSEVGRDRPASWCAAAYAGAILRSPAQVHAG